MTSYLLETSFIIDFLKNKQGAVKTMEEIEGGRLGTSSICVAEAYEGALYADKKEMALKGLEEFLKGLDTIWNVDTAVAKEFAQLRGQLRGKGKLIDDLDIFIAATCLIYKITLVTFNVRHFQRITALKIMPTTGSI